MLSQSVVWCVEVEGVGWEPRLPLELARVAAIAALITSISTEIMDSGLMWR